ncbi:hypothetical protein EZV62_012888 [Acer yangbiense]|uniref:Phospholipase A(2) n=1 Tax=Acer yangbiense TaxID=1000413 RepID=A0A5C7HXH9_9ROSI|nr:hypothetical protein EZV62_012888 [Acer yangbiense]
MPMRPPPVALDGDDKATSVALPSSIMNEATANGLHDLFFLFYFFNFRVNLVFLETTEFRFQSQEPIKSSIRQTTESKTCCQRQRLSWGMKMEENNRMLLGAVVSVRTRVTLAFAFIFFFLIVFIDCANNDSQVKCSRTCVAQNCNSVGIRYGKYCGVGWTGCPGEKPCDDLDACCKIHDECVEKKGMVASIIILACSGWLAAVDCLPIFVISGLTNVRCHEKFKTCIKKVQKSGNIGFSRDCPYDRAVPTMVQGMDMAILLSQFGNSKLEL